jgi:hypothetical protein
VSPAAATNVRPIYSWWQREFRQLVDILVLRGYIAREIDPADGRVSLTLTERGRAANEIKQSLTGPVIRRRPTALNG